MTSKQPLSRAIETDENGPLHRMMVKLTIGGIVCYTSLFNFFVENSFTITERKAIRRSLREGKPYHGGGGAMVAWKVEVDR